MDKLGHGCRADSMSAICQTIDDCMASLQPSAREVIGCAAVLGLRIDASLVAMCIDVSDDVVLDSLGKARKVGLVQCDDDRSGSYRFRHALTRSAICGLVESADARALHARIARHLERMPDRQKRIEQLLYHYLGAADPRNAASCAEAAGERAIDVGAYDDAAAYFAIACANAPGSALRERLHRRLSTALQKNGI